MITASRDGERRYLGNDAIVVLWIPMVARFLHGAGWFEHEENHENCSIGSLESPFVPANLLRNLWVQIFGTSLI